jgi:hypothetical protein
MHAAQTFVRGAIGFVPRVVVADFFTATGVPAPSAESWAVTKLSGSNNEIHRRKTCKRVRLVRSIMEVPEL